MTPPDRNRPLPLFEYYGGMSALRSVVMNFYDKALDSDVIGPFFEDIDLARLVDHQTKFIATLLGGPASFSDERLARAHSHLVVNHIHFDEIVLLLSETLTEAGFSEVDRLRVLIAVESKRSLIVAEVRHAS